VCVYVCVFSEKVTLLLYRNNVFSVGIRLWAGWSGVPNSVGKRDMSSPSSHNARTGSGSYPASYSVVSSASLHGVKRPGSEADHSLPLCSEVHNEWGHNSTPPLRLYGLYTPSENCGSYVVWGLRIGLRRGVKIYLKVVTQEVSFPKNGWYYPKILSPL
jgi:hypothetical protein